jgi:hypothetical protein
MKLIETLLKEKFDLQIDDELSFDDKKINTVKKFLNYCCDELNLDNSRNANQPSNSLFEFHFLSASGDMQTLPLEVDKDWEGTMIMFPSWLHHSVYPFYTSDNYRISIAGNIYVKMEK